MLPYLINISDESLLLQSQYAAEMYISGLYGNIVTPTSVWYNGATYITGYKDSTTNNSPIIFKYSNGAIEKADVGTTTNPDPSGLQHAFPAVLVIGGFIYVFQVNGHGHPIQIWKSNVAESIADGFTLHSTIPGTFGYVNPRLLPDGRILILSRVTSTDGFGHVFALSGVNDFTTWTVKETTYPDYLGAHRRHYPVAPYYYGTNQWVYFGVQHRYEPVRGQQDFYYYANSIYKTQDFSTFYNLDETWSKNIDVNGVITEAELEANCNIAGSNTNLTGYTGGINFVVIDDVIYTSYFSNGTWKFIKIVNGVKTEYPTNIENIRDPGAKNTQNNLFYFNGQNLVSLIYRKENGIVSRDIHAHDLNFQNSIFQYELFGNNELYFQATLPYNFDEVTGTYLIGGSNDPENLYYIELDDKFLI